MVQIVPGKKEEYSDLLTKAADYFASNNCFDKDQIRPVAEFIAYLTCFDMIDDREAITDAISIFVHSRIA